MLMAIPHVWAKFQLELLPFFLYVVLALCLCSNPQVKPACVNTQRRPMKFSSQIYCVCYGFNVNHTANIHLNVETWLVNISPKSTSLCFLIQAQQSWTSSSTNFWHHVFSGSLLRGTFWSFCILDTELLFKYPNNCLSSLNSTNNSRGSLECD